MLIPQDLLFVLSIVVSGISHYLRDAGLPRAVNALIASISIVAITAVVIAATTGFTADIKSDVLLFCSTLAALIPGIKELVDLLNYLKAAPSPLLPAVVQYPPLTRRASGGTPITFQDE
jgi:hypothetical protein